jgi:hypothetical protein
MATEDDVKWKVRPWLETLAIIVIGTGLSMELSSADHWRSGSVTSFLLLLPVLCGAQYGLMHGAISGALLSTLTFVLADAYGRALPAELTSWSIACIGIGAVAGQFRDMAERRRRVLTHGNRVLEEQLERAKRNVLTLKLSHAQLEERLAARRWSFASSLEMAEQRMQTLSSPRELGEALLELLASQAMVQAASLYAVKGGALLPAPVATLGQGKSDAHGHALVARALQTKRLAAIADPAGPIPFDPSVLAAVPLLTSAGDLIGVVAIHQLPFIAFNSQQLRKLLLIAAQLTDLMQDRLSALQKQQDMDPQATSVRLVPSRQLGRSGALPQAQPSPGQRSSSPSSQGLKRRQRTDAPVAR